MPDLTSFWISLRVAITSTIIVTILGIFVSKWLYNKKGHWVKILESFIILPIVLPPTVLGFILLIVFFNKRTYRSVPHQYSTLTSSFYFDRCSTCICHC